MTFDSFPSERNELPPAIGWATPFAFALAQIKAALHQAEAQLTRGIRRLPVVADDLVQRDASADDEQRLRKHSSSIIVKGARCAERLLDEVTLFLHQVEGANDWFLGLGARESLRFPEHDADFMELPDRWYRRC